ncbi:MAG: signal recognition particle-docking protein FtsY, partial [Methanobrevibacter sp.]|nr:signal recognition particle-docking protein FtsY [Methanobrevibacter sp.]
MKKKFSRTSEKLEEELIEEAEQEDNLKEETGTRFSFFSFGKKQKEEKEEDESNLLPEAEKALVEEEIDDVLEELPEDEVEEESKEDKKSHFWSRNKDKAEDAPDEDDEI